MSKPVPSREEFRAFLQRVVAGELTVNDWNLHIIARYSDVDLEAVRQQLARHAVLCGQCSAQPSSAGLAELAGTLLEQLSS